MWLHNALWMHHSLRNLVMKTICLTQSHLLPNSLGYEIYLSESTSQHGRVTL